jgi:hypothetical protein
MPNAEPRPEEGRKPLGGIKKTILALLFVGILVGWPFVSHESPWQAVFFAGAILYLILAASWTNWPRRR